LDYFVVFLCRFFGELVSFMPGFLAQILYFGLCGRPDFTSARLRLGAATCQQGLGLRHQLSGFRFRSGD